MDNVASQDTIVLGPDAVYMSLTLKVVTVSIWMYKVDEHTMAMVHSEVIREDDKLNRSKLEKDQNLVSVEA